MYKRIIEHSEFYGMLILLKLLTDGAIAKIADRWGKAMTVALRFKIPVYFEINNILGRVTRWRSR